MDFLKLFAEQERSGFPDLAGSGAEGAIRVSERLLNAILAEQLRESTAIRELRVQPRAGDRAGVRIVFAKLFVPSISFEAIVDKQPSLPGDPVLALTLSGASGLLRFAGPFLSKLPPGMRLEGERVFVDVRAALAPHGLTSVLNHVEAVRVTTDEGHLVVSFKVRAGG